MKTTLHFRISKIVTCSIAAEVDLAKDKRCYTGSPIFGQGQLDKKKKVLREIPFMLAFSTNVMTNKIA